jgi:hypothetical protein
MSKDAKEYLAMLKEGCDIIPEDEMWVLCEKLKEIFSNEPNVVMLEPPVTVCGDIHG